MFTAIFWSFLNWVNNILLKASIQLNRWWDALFLLFSQIQFFIIAIILVFFWKINFLFWDKNSIVYLLIILAIAFWSLYAVLFQYSFRNEKVSVLQPYTSLDKIFVIIMWFIFLESDSIITFIISIFTFILIVLFSIDYKNIKISKTVILFIIWNLFASLRTLITWYLLILMSSINFVMLYSLIFVPLLLSYMSLRKEIWNFKLNSKKFYLYRSSTSIVWWVTYFISIFLIKDLWIILSSLLSLISLITTLILAYFLFKDIPKKKDVILSIMVLVMIGLWYFLS